MHSILMAALAASLTLAPLGAQSPESVVDHAVAVYAKVHTERATFTQTITNPITGTTLTSHGEMQQRKPGLVDVRFTDPAGDRIVSDGKYLWIYLPSTNPGQVIRTAPAKDGAGTPDIAAQFLDSPKTRYTISDAGSATIAGHETHAVVLVPKEPMSFTKATVWVDDDDGFVRQFETVEENGVTRLVTLNTISINGPTDRSAFSFKVPKGVHVYDRATGDSGT
ncbi:MAG TPA: outer membrane lipoprotein chaperone LolA [Gemmatimonadaceae bacterium]|nr:outer membrane lipoprotein chaperone LolA [Gemmatimonadaceae bacterium]